jgi:3-polyprenyl-4-hydroxybenzoate decarboxylase
MLATKYKSDKRMGKGLVHVVKRQPANSAKLRNKAKAAKEGATIATTRAVAKLTPEIDSFQN